MKKLISLVMAGLMLLSALALASCKKEPKPQPSQTEASATTSDNSNPCVSSLRIGESSFRRFWIVAIGLLQSTDPTVHQTEIPSYTMPIA